MAEDTQNTTLVGRTATATFSCAQNMHVANELKVFVTGADNLTAVQAKDDSRAVYLKNDTEKDQTVTVTLISLEGEQVRGTVTIPAGQTRLVSLVDNAVTAAAAVFPGGDTGGEGTGVTSKAMNNPSSASVYDLTGRRVATATGARRLSLQPGVYIVDGQKTILQ